MLPKGILKGREGGRRERKEQREEEGEKDGGREEVLSLLKPGLKISNISQLTDNPMRGSK